MKLNEKQSRPWDLGSISKKGKVFWQTIIVSGTDIIICRVCGATADEAIDLAYNSIIDFHNNNI